MGEKERHETNLKVGKGKPSGGCRNSLLLLPSTVLSLFGLSLTQNKRDDGCDSACANT